MLRLSRSLPALLVSVLVLSFSLMIAVARVNAAPPDHVLVALIDRSTSTNELTPPDQMQAFLLHLMDLLGLSGEQTRLAVIYYGVPNGVAVIAGPDEQPTAATATLKHRLLTDFPKAEGSTPMDPAYECALEIIGKLPIETLITVLNITDGLPDSGRLRPKDFPEIGQLMQKERERCLAECKSRGYSPKITEAITQRLELVWSNPTTEEFRKVYTRQIQLEFRKVLDCAAVLAKRKVRFVTVAFADTPQLKEIHQAANGTDKDYVVSAPDKIIPRLHALGLTQLPRVVKQDVLDIPADLSAFERDFIVPLDPLAGSIVVGFQFHPAIENFEQMAKLTAIIDGRAIEGSLDHAEDQLTLVRDGKQQLATVAITLDRPTASRQVTLRFTSPNRNRHVPAVTVYTHFRLADGLTPMLRPIGTAINAPAPLVVSTTSAATWVSGIVNTETGQHHPLRSVDVLLRNTRTGQELKLTLAADASTPGMFVADPIKLPVGIYDATLHFVTMTGATFSLTLPRHIESRVKEERATLQISHATDSANDSLKPNQFDFGEVGDAVVAKTIEFLIRTEEIDGPINVILNATIADANGHVITNWIRFDRSQLTLHPGRAEKVRLLLKLPSNIEDAIEDGVCVGQFTLTRTDGNQPLELRPFEKISGADDDVPVNQVSFVLKRPGLGMRSPWAGGNWLTLRPEGRNTLPINVSIGPLQRDLTIDVTNTSAITRSIAVLPAGRVTDATGDGVAGLTMVPAERTETRQDVAAGKTARWTYRFGADGNIGVSKAETAFDVRGNGLKSYHIIVPIAIRHPSLGSRIQNSSALLAGIMGLACFAACVRARRWRRLQPGQTHLVTCRRPLKGLFELESPRPGTVHLIPAVDARVGSAGDLQPRAIAMDQPLPLDVSKTSERAIVFQTVEEEDVEPCVVEITDVVAANDDAQAHAMIVGHPDAERQTRTARRSVFKRLIVAVAFLLIATTLYQPAVMTAAQWLYDFCFPVR